MWTRICELFKPKGLVQDQPVMYNRQSKFMNARWLIGHYACQIDGVDYVFSCGRTSHTTNSIVPVREWVKK